MPAHSPGDAGQISLSVRNSINFGLFEGPRITAAGRYLTTRQGLTDWYPTWIGVPERGYDPYKVTDLAWTNWNDLYAQERVAELGILPSRSALAPQPS